MELVFFIFPSAFFKAKLICEKLYVHSLDVTCFVCVGFMADDILMLVIAISIFFLTIWSMLHRCFNLTYGLAKQLVASFYSVVTLM